MQPNGAVRWSALASCDPNYGLVRHLHQLTLYDSLFRIGQMRPSDAATLVAGLEGTTLEDNVATRRAALIARALARGILRRWGQFEEPCNFERLTCALYCRWLRRQNSQPR
jgi:hypothetical protein